VSTWHAKNAGGREAGHAQGATGDQEALGGRDNEVPYLNENNGDPKEERRNGGAIGEGGEQHQGLQ